VAADAPHGERALKVRGLAILMTAGLSAFLVGALVLLTFGPKIGRWIANLVGLGQVFELARNIPRRPVIVGFMALTMAFLYYTTPDVEQQWQWIPPGSACAVICWLLASLGFAFYVNHFGSIIRPMAASVPSSCCGPAHKRS
jgi:membrane protein